MRPSLQRLRLWISSSRRAPERLGCPLRRVASLRAVLRAEVTADEDQHGEHVDGAADSPHDEAAERLVLGILFNVLASFLPIAY